MSGPRPPWTNEARIKADCISCERCIDACPEGILVHGPAKTPMVDFKQGECTFCKTCAQACPEDVFFSTDLEPWHMTAQIADGCLLGAGISCQICTDFCEPEALRIDLSQRPAGRIVIDMETCTGCGACVAACPEAVISVVADG